ncbi:MAG: eCIS core domain-containing protein [Rhizomicrobium sp.]
MADRILQLPFPGTMRASQATPPNRHATSRFVGSGEPLPPLLRGFFERRLDHDFSGVRVHRGPAAEDSARSLGARAYTHGRDIVFGAGAYAPARVPGLLAHELAHVAQQHGGQPFVQMSALSDDIKKTWNATPRIEALLTRLSQADVQGAQNDADIDNELATLLAKSPDDLFLAQKIRKGELGRTAAGPGKPQGRPIQVFFFKGSTDRRALVIAGVHGSERQGMDVAQRLIKDLQAAATPPVLTTIIVPSLFPDNAARGKMGIREGGTPTNRNFPDPSEDLAASKAAGKGTAVDASKDGAGKRSRAILPENIMLLEVMEKFHPERIISIHGTRGPGSAGVFYDARNLRPDETKAAQEEGRAAADLYDAGDPWEAAAPDERAARKKALERELIGKSATAKRDAADKTDRDLSLNAAKRIDAATTGLKGREQRAMGREKRPDGKPETAAETAKAVPDRRAHPSVAGNVGSTGALDSATWSGGVPGGVSLGQYASQRGVSIFTVEPPLNFNTDDYKHAPEKVTQADRATELQAYADAVRTILLGS